MGVFPRFHGWIGEFTPVPYSTGDLEFLAPIPEPPVRHRFPGGSALTSGDHTDVGGEKIRAFAPGSIGNLACGYDVLGLALQGPGDEVVVTRVSGKGIRITAIHGDGGRLSRVVGENAAGTAAQAVLDELGIEAGIELELRKGLPLSAGMGGSAASAVAAAVAVDDLLGSRLPKDVLLHCALAGEAVAAGEGHTDNAAPSLLGGLVLIPTWEPLTTIELEVPRELVAVHVHPHIEIETAAARKVLGDTVALADAVTQWGNTAALVAGLFRQDWDLIARSVEDRIAEPLRSVAVPGFSAVKTAALDSGALASSLSGSGPSLFALCRGKERAEIVGKRMVQAFKKAAGLEADLLISEARAPGARILPV
jgi:homoserine kinase